MSKVADDAHTFFVSGAQDGVRHWIQNLLEIADPHVEIGPTFDFSTDFIVIANCGSFDK